MLIAEKFEQILLDFLKVYHPRKIKKVPKIVDEFKGNELELLKALCVKYGKDFSAIPELKDAIGNEILPVIENDIEDEKVVIQIEESIDEADQLDELDDKLVEE